MLGTLMPVFQPAEASRALGADDVLAELKLRVRVDSRPAGQLLLPKHAVGEMAHRIELRKTQKIMF
jgi:hypothetical protein